MGQKGGNRTIVLLSGVAKAISVKDVTDMLNVHLANAGGSNGFRASSEMLESSIQYAHAVSRKYAPGSYRFANLYDYFDDPVIFFRENHNPDRGEVFLQAFGIWADGATAVLAKAVRWVWNQMSGNPKFATRDITEAKLMEVLKEDLNPDSPRSDLRRVMAGWRTYDDMKEAGLGAGIVRFLKFAHELMSEKGSG